MRRPSGLTASLVGVARGPRRDGEDAGIGLRIGRAGLVGVALDPAHLPGMIRPRENGAHVRRCAPLGRARGTDRHGAQSRSVAPPPAASGNDRRPSNCPAARRHRSAASAPAARNGQADLRSRLGSASSAHRRRARSSPALADRLRRRARRCASAARQRSVRRP